MPVNPPRMAKPLSPKSDICAWGVLLLVAILLRGIVIWKFGANLDADVDHYLGIARNLAAGHGFFVPGTNTPTAYRPPLYPLMLAGLLWLNGSSLAIGILQLVLGAWTVLLTVIAGRRLGLGRWALAAGLIVTCDPLLLYNTSLIMTETLAALLATLLLCLAIDVPLLQQTATVIHSTLGKRLLLGIVFGLCCLCRPTFFAFAMLTTCAALAGLFRKAPVAVPERVRGKLTAKTGRLAVAWPVVLGTAVVLAPWAIRNAAVFGHPILTTTHGGYTLLLGHNPVYYREVVDQPWGRVWSEPSLTAWQKSLEERMAAAVPPVKGEDARDRWMYAGAWALIRGEPAHAVRAGLTLLGRFWNVSPLGSQTARLGVPALWGIRAFYSLMLLAMLLGVARLRGAEWIRWRPLLLLIASFTLVHCLYWADMRMRAPLIPAIALLSARGLMLCRKHVAAAA